MYAWHLHVQTCRSVLMTHHVQGMPSCHWLRSLSRERELSSYASTFFQGLLQGTREPNQCPPAVAQARKMVHWDELRGLLKICKPILINLSGQAP